MGQVDQVIVVVVVDSVDLGVGFGLGGGVGTFSRLLWACLMALMSMEVAWMYFSLSLGGTLWQMRMPSLSERTMPLRAWNYSTILLRNSVLYPPIDYIIIVIQFRIYSYV